MLAVHAWLSALGLGQYEDALTADGFDTLDHITTIVADDLEDVCACARVCGCVAVAVAVCEGVFI